MVTGGVHSLMQGGTKAAEDAAFMVVPQHEVHQVLNAGLRTRPSGKTRYLNNFAINLSCNHVDWHTREFLLHQGCPGHPSSGGVSLEGNAAQIFSSCFRT